MEINDENIDKVKKGCASAAVQILLFIGASTAFFMIGAKFIGMSLKLLWLLPGWVLFLVIWIFTIIFLKKTFSKAKTSFEDREFIEGTTLTNKELKSILSKVEESINKIKRISYRIKSSVVQAKVEKINEIIKKIYDNFKSDPKDIKKGKQFLHYYLDTIVKILTKYIEMNKHKDSSEEIGKRIEQIENTLDTMISALDKQYNQLLENDVLDIDVELQVLKNTLKSEGLN